MELQVKHTFDDKTYRHYMNGHLSVLHCHHYMSLTTALAEEMTEIGGVKILREVAEDSVRPLFDDYFVGQSVTDPRERLNVGAAYYSYMGMGKIEVVGAETYGSVRLIRSHVDEGWVKKWGKSDKPINHFTCGYVAAMFAAAYSKPARSYRAIEKTSLAAGAQEGQIIVTPAP